MSRASRDAAGGKVVNLALQGGGSHGAYTWGALDALIEDERIEIGAISGASAALGGRWYTFDPRNNMPRIGRVLIAQGRDAADVPITHTFGPNTLVSFKVWTDEVS